MIITIPELGLQIRPYSQGPCWHMFELVTNRTNKGGEPLPDEWKSCGLYPCTLDHAFTLCRERAARRSKVSGSLADAIREIQRMDDALHTALEGSFEGIAAP